ncbi:MAG: response regulator [Flavobacteriales bacterium]
MEHILIVEDEQELRNSLEQILELAGYTVSLAENGRVGYERIMDETPDLVLCDVNMPQMDGFEMLGAINQRMDEEVLPIFLFLTARVELDDIRHGLKLGADDYIVKPFDHKELLDTIRLRIDRRKQLVDSGKRLSANDSIAKKFNKLALPCEDGLEVYEFDAIVKCEADRAYCSFHLISGKKVLVSKPMKEFEQLLLDRHFIKIHKSTIVNINCITKYVRGKGGYLVLSDGSHADVSFRKREEVSQMLRENL